MKKLICLAIVLVMTIGVLTACGDSKEEQNSTQSAATLNQTITNNFDVSENATEEAYPIATSNTVITTSPAPQTQQAIDTAGAVVMDNEFCKIVITGSEIDSLWGYTVKLSIENKSTTTDIAVSSDYISVNGVESTALLYTNILAGKTANDEISFYDNFNNNDIGEFTDIEIALSVSEEGEFVEKLAETVYNYYPLGKASASKFTYTAKPTDKTIINNNGVTVIVTNREFDDLWGYSAEIYIENKTDKALMFSLEDASLNDIMIDPYFAQSINPGKVAFGKINWFDADLEDNKIDKVDKIEFTLRAYDMNDFVADDVVNQKVTINP